MLPMPVPPQMQQQQQPQQQQQQHLGNTQMQTQNSQSVGPPRVDFDFKGFFDYFIDIYGEIIYVCWEGGDRIDGEIIYMCWVGETGPMVRLSLCVG